MTGLSILATLQAELGDLDRIERIVKVFGMVNVAPGFDQTPAVIDGCSDLLLEVFGERGRHTRSAVGLAELPVRHRGGDRAHRHPPHRERDAVDGELARPTSTGSAWSPSRRRSRRCQRLHRAQVERVPYETMWIHAGERWGIDPRESMRPHRPRRPRRLLLPPQRRLQRAARARSATP